MHSQRASTPRGQALSVASHLAPAVLPAYALATRRIGEALGRSAELVVASDYGRCVADRDDVCFVCSIPYILLAEAGDIGMIPIAAPVLDGARYAARPVYFSEVVVDAAGPFRTFDDLEGTRWAFNEPFSHSGFLVALHHLAARGGPPSFIGEWIEAGYHDDALHMVLDGRADWAAIDSHVLDLWRRWRPSIRLRLRTVTVLGPSTVQPVVASTRRLTAVDRRKVADALIGLDADPLGRSVLRASGIRRFTPIADSGYADIREMLSRVDGAGLLPAWWRARWEALSPGVVSRRSPERAPAPAERTHRSPRPRTSSPRPSGPRS